MFRALFISLILMVGLCGADDMCETLQSAFTVGEVSYLMTDQRVFLLKHGSESDEDVGIPTRLPGQMAATGLPHGDGYALLSCAGSVLYSNDGVPLSFGFNNIDFSAMDAAITFGDEVFLFAGSIYRSFNYSSGELSEVKHLEQLELPGYVNAAFHDPYWSAAVVVQGDEIYLADDSDPTHTFYGPLPFTTFYDVDSLTLCSTDHYYPRS